MPLITSADYDWIRHRIDQSLNTTSVPDGRIEEVQPEAEEWVEARVTDLDDIAESDDEEDVKRYTHAKRAAWYYAASLIAPGVNIPTSDAGIAGASYTRKVMEPAANAARLKARAEEELDAATEEEESAPRVGRSGSARVESVW